jgi:hypothetical protein
VPGRIAQPRVVDQILRERRREPICEPPAGCLIGIFGERVDLVSEHAGFGVYVHHLPQIGHRLLVVEPGVEVQDGTVGLGEVRRDGLEARRCVGRRVAVQDGRDIVPGPLHALDVRRESSVQLP